jgi:carbamoyl-phosphate synthase large subunit
MSKRLNLHKILILGSGPIVIGQGCEFDYSGVQACKALKAEGYEIVLVNSNPATIMTDPEIADHTYIEPITWQTVAKIIEVERPDAILSTMGGQTALNCALELDAHGILSKYNVELIGANKDAIKKAEDRELFRLAMEKIGLEMPKSGVAFDMEQACKIQQELGFPCIIRPSFTLGGSGGGIAYNEQDFIEICTRGFALSMNHQLLIEESLIGWKEYELEVIRDVNDSCIIVCTIENLDPMGIHTGDSITVAPAQTLTDVEYQKMRDAAIAVLREIGVQTGGSNVQFAVNPQNGRMIVIEMNPRVSRSSALASKATGFPIAKIAALLAVGYTLDELRNDITNGLIPASFEPSIDYVVVKIPRFNFDKFPLHTRLTTQMQSVGEVMAIGSTFQIALQKALCSLELDICGFNPQVDLKDPEALNIIKHELQNVGSLRLLYVADAVRLGLSIEAIHALTHIDPWFIDQIQDLILTEQDIAKKSFTGVSRDELFVWKNQGFSDARLAALLNVTEDKVFALRQEYDITTKFKRIDSCAAEFPASTAYLYSTYQGDCEARPSQRQKIIVLGSGPNRIGQGIEFDYCCVQAVQALQDKNIEAIMINCNPETVSTDYDISDRLYFEPLTLEAVLEIINVEKPLGVILQFGGQTPLKLAMQLQQYGVKILGTAPGAIDLAEDRGKFSKIIEKLGLAQPENAMAYDLDSGLLAAKVIGFPLMVRPSYVLGGRLMEIINNEESLLLYLQKIFTINKSNSVLLDRYLQNALELDVDVIADAHGNVFVAGIMQHIEPAGVHSGDSACVVPPYALSDTLQEAIKLQAQQLALELKVNGVMNIQFAISQNKIYILEVNPRASRTIPFISKSIGIPLVKIAIGCILNESLAKMRLPVAPMNRYAVKQAVFPFGKFPNTDPLLGPEMRSTGEVMSFGDSFAEAYLKTMQAVHGVRNSLWTRAFLHIQESHFPNLQEFALELVESGVELCADPKTANYLNQKSISCNILSDNDRILSLISSGAIDFVVSTISYGLEMSTARKIRSYALTNRVQYTTTLAAARAMLLAMRSIGAITAYKLQTLHEARRVLEHDY